MAALQLGDQVAELFESLGDSFRVERRRWDHEARDAEVFELFYALDTRNGTARRDLDLRRIAADLLAFVAHDGEELLEFRVVRNAGEEAVAVARDRKST